MAGYDGEGIRKREYGIRLNAVRIPYSIFPLPFPLFRIPAVILVLALVFWPTLVAAAPTVDEVAGQLICQCGCTMVVTTCECGTAEVIRKEIKEKIEQGQSSQQILASYVEQYGEKVLAAPTKTGFNLTAWLTPFAAIAGGGGVVYVAVRTWVGRRGAPGADSEETLGAASPAQLEEYEQRLQRELAEEE